MDTLGHIRATRAQGEDWQTSLLAAVPDVFAGVGAVSPSLRVKRWCAWAHHSARAYALASYLSGPLGEAWAYHMSQDESTHPPGTYRVPEAAGLPSGVAIAYSGGPDSFIAWRLLGCPAALYVDVGSASAAREMDLAEAVNGRFGSPFIQPAVRIVRGTPMSETGTGWIPYRNLSLILAVAQLSPDVVLARIAEWGPDKNPAFFRRTERLLASSRGGHFQAAADLPRVRIWTPFGHLTKTRLVARYLEEFGRQAGADDLVRYTRSCYAGGEQFCGECGACFCRYVAFVNNGIDEHDRYAKVPQRLEYYRRLHWRDFRPSMMPMYVKRHLEMRGYE